MVAEGKVDRRAHCESIVNVLWLEVHHYVWRNEK